MANESTLPKKDKILTSVSNPSKGMQDLLLDPYTTRPLFSAAPAIDRVLLQVQRDLASKNLSDEELGAYVKAINAVGNTFIRFRDEGEAEYKDEQRNA